MHDAIVIVTDSIHVLRSVELCSETLCRQDVQLACAGRPCVASDCTLAEREELTDRDLRNHQDGEAFSLLDNTISESAHTSDEVGVLEVITVVVLHRSSGERVNAEVFLVINILVAERSVDISQVIRGDVANVRCSELLRRWHCNGCFVTSFVQFTKNCRSECCIDRKEVFLLVDRGCEAHHGRGLDVDSTQDIIFLRDVISSFDSLARHVGTLLGRTSVRSLDAVPLREVGSSYITTRWKRLSVGDDCIIGLEAIDTNGVALFCFLSEHLHQHWCCWESDEFSYIVAECLTIDLWICHNIFPLIIELIVRFVLFRTVIQLRADATEEL